MVYDVVIVGVGPAGATAGALLARKGHSIALVGRGRALGEDSGIGWVGAQAATLLEATGTDVVGVLDRPIQRVEFLNAELNQTTTPTLASAPGFVINQGAIEDALIKTAAAAGAQTMCDSAVTNLVVREDAVDVHVEGGGRISGRILLLATGRRCSLADRLGLTGPAGTHWSAHLRVPLAKASGDGEPTATIVLGLTREGGFAVILACGNEKTVSVTMPGSQNDALAWLGRLCRLLTSLQMLPGGLDDPVGQAIVVPPSPAALEMESHVGKHALIIGEAGGFVAAVSDEGIVPGIWSAKIAAEVVTDALSSVQSQDRLMTFDTRWRLEMAEYLRPPNTDMQFLVPLIFSNQPMADRMAAAFFLGENI